MSCTPASYPQDLTVHTREVHSKLVEIMQDRLLLAARQLAIEARTWGVVQQQQPQPCAAAQGFEVSPAVRSLAKQLSTLQTVLVPILQEEEVSTCCACTRDPSLAMRGYDSAPPVECALIPSCEPAFWGAQHHRAVS